ncbi:MAG: exonuclease domain-containing protein [Bacteroidales bacterium]
MYCIIDIETTGLSPDTEKITEIAIYVHDGNRVVDEFTSLLNPERPIPYFITRMTGITNEMVENAPRFYEIARKIIELTENRIFVAHNVEFDYGFVKSEFASLGYEFKRNRLCTVKLSKKIFPGLPSYSLGKITGHFGISISDRHRAAGDAFATVKLFEHLLKEDAKSKPLIEEMAYHSVKNLNPYFNKSILDNLPEKTGVYYFYDEKKDLIYVGKSINIRSRVLQHLNNNTTRKAIEMKEKITDISFELTGSELIALLLESDEIKKHKPIYNRSQRRTSYQFGIFKFFDDKGYLNLMIGKNDGKEIPLITFSNVMNARNFAEQLVVKYGLCQKLCGIYNNTGPCFNLGIKECKGACVGLETASDYNMRAEKAVNNFEFRFRNFIIIDKGRIKDEKSVVCIKNGTYQGFGFFDNTIQSENPEFLAECIKKYPDNRDIQSILRSYLNLNQVVKIIPFSDSN